MLPRVKLCLAAAGLMAAAASPTAARPLRKAPSPARGPAAPPTREVLAEGVCRYVLTQSGDPQDEVRFLFRSAEMPLPRRGAVTPVVALRDYRPDMPETAPEAERRVYAHEVARFEIVPESAAPGDSGPARWSRTRVMPGLPPGPELKMLGLPWLSLPAPRAGLTWQRTEAIEFPHLRERFRYRVTGLTTVGGRRAWRVERTLAGDLAAPRTVPELKTPAGVAQWQETFWVDAASQELLRLERRVRLVTREAQPFQLSLEVDWARKSVRSVPVAEYQTRVSLFGRLAELERKIQEASTRTTLDGPVDLQDLKQKLEDLHEKFPQRRYQPAFDKLGAAITRGLLSFQQREDAERQKRAAS